MRGEKWRGEELVVKRKVMTELEEQRKQMVCGDFFFFFSWLRF